MLLIENKHTYILHLPTVSLMPGMNEVSESDWELAKDLPVIVARLDSEHLIIKSESFDGSLKSVDAKAAIKIIKETVKLEALEKYLAEEKRKDVAKAITEQIKSISLETK